MNFYYRAVYSYDIPACHYNILKNSGFDISHLPENDKFERNRLIGLMMKNDPKLTKFLRSTTKEIIDYYIESNAISKDELLLVQYDGFYTTKKLTLKHKKEHLAHLAQRDFYDVFLFSICRRMYIAKTSDGRLLVKGVPNKYPQLEKLYTILLSLNFMSKKSISSGLNFLKNYLLTCQDKEFFLIPVETPKNSFRFYMKEFGEMVISKKALKMVSIDEIEKQLYFHIYLEPFFKAIVFDLF